MKLSVEKYLTPETVFTVVGFVWFGVSAAWPIVPKEMPISQIIPGLAIPAITPGLLVSLSLIPIVVKYAVPGHTPFFNTAPAPAVTTTTATVTTTAPKEGTDG